MKKKIKIFCCSFFILANVYSQAKIIGDFGADAPFSKIYLKLSYGSFPKIIDSFDIVKGKFEIRISDSILQLEPTIALLAAKNVNGKFQDLFCRNYLEPKRKLMGFYFYKNVFYVSGNFPDGKNAIYDLKPNLENDVYFDRYFENSNDWRVDAGPKLDAQVSYIKKYGKSQYLINKLVFSKTAISTENLKRYVGAFDKEALQSKNGKAITNYLQNRIEEDTHSPYKNLQLKNPALQDELIFHDLKEANIIIFWASWCSPCRREIPLLKKLYDKLKSKNAQFQFVSISADEQLEKWQKADKEVALPWRSLWSPDIKKLREAYNYSLPSNLLITKEGKMYKIDLRHQESVDAVYKALGLPPEKFDFEE